jgi:hypothetical protein
LREAGAGGVATSADRKEKTSRRLPLILWGLFALACVVALILVGDLARYQEAGLVSESRAALRDVNDPAQFDQALRKYPGNRILKLVALANEKSAAIEAATRKMLDEAEPAALAKPADLTTATRSDLDALRANLKLAESNTAAFKPRLAALIKARRDELEGSARSLGLESGIVARFMAAIDEQFAEMAALTSGMLGARAEYYGAYEKCAALLVREFGSYKVTGGQFIFRLQPTADSYNAASTAMVAARKRLAELEDEKGALKASRLGRWKNFVDG